VADTQESFDARLYEAFQAAADNRSKVEAFKKEAQVLRRLAREWPLGTAEQVARDLYEVLSRLMELKRQQAAELYGTDIADPEWPKGFKKLDDVVEAGKLLMMANMHLVYEECLRRLDTCMREKGLSEEELIAKVYEVSVEALRATDAVLLHTLHELRLIVSPGSEEVINFARDAEAQHLASHLATRISVTINRRLARALDEIREHSKPAGRERLETLLRELYVLAPESWAHHHVTDWQLEATRSAVVQQIERNQAPRVEEIELATFAEREALLRRGWEAGLPPSEYELLKLLMANPKITNRKAAAKLGKSIGAVKKLKHNIKKTLGAA